MYHLEICSYMPYHHIYTLIFILSAGEAGGGVTGEKVCLCQASDHRSSLRFNICTWTYVTKLLDNFQPRLSTFSASGFKVPSKRAVDERICDSTNREAIHRTSLTFHDSNIWFRPLPLYAITLERMQIFLPQMCNFIVTSFRNLSKNQLNKPQIHEWVDMMFT